MIKRLMSKKGVTLVELLAVIVILGIIAAIAVPTIGGLIDRQEEKAAQLTYDTIVTSAELYADGSDTPFTLADLEEDFIDLKDNEFAWDLDDDGTLEPVANKALIWIVVDGSTVTFYDDADVDSVSDPIALEVGATADTLYINGYAVE